MKFTIMSSLFLTVSAFAQGAPATPCDAVAERILRHTIQGLGYPEAIGFELQNSSEEFDPARREKLLNYSSSVLIVDDGYLPGSGAVLTLKASNCEIVRITVHLR